MNKEDRERFELLKANFPTLTEPQFVMGKKLADTCQKGGEGVAQLTLIANLFSNRFDAIPDMLLREAESHFLNAAQMCRELVELVERANAKAKSN